MRLFLGLLLIPLFLTLANLPFGLPLDVASRAISIMGLALSVYSLCTEKGLIRELTRHPFVKLYLLFTLGFLCLQFRPYFSSVWDEYSHWLTMPKQMFLHRSIFHPDFQVKDLASYTPAWPLTLIFHDLVFGKHFETLNGLCVVLIESLFCAAALCEHVKDYFEEESQGITSHQIIPALALIIIGGVFFKFFAPTNVMVEKPMLHSVLVLFSYAGLMIKKNRKSVTLGDSAIIGLIISYQYLLKVTFMTLVPVCILWVFISQTSWTMRFKALFCVFSPYLLIYIMWALHLRVNAITPVFTPISLREPSMILARFTERAEVWQKLPGAVLGILRHTLPLKFAGLLSFFVFLRNEKDKLKRRFEWSAVFFLVFYLACLVWMYFVSFSDYDAKRLASFARYMSIPLGVLIYFGLWKGFLACCGKLDGKVQLRWAGPALKFVVLVAFICMMISGYRSRGSGSPLFGDADRLAALLQERGLVRPKVLVVSQGSKLFEIHVLRFLSIGPKNYLFDIDSSGASFGPQNDNVWRTVLTEDAMREKIMSNDIVWMVRSDPWMDQILSQLPLRSEWKKSFDDVFLIRNENGFECVSKR
jgi:hypothetical protein